MRLPSLLRRHRDHWDHLSQVEERSRNGRFTLEARRHRDEAPARGAGRSDAGAPDLTVSMPRVGAEPLMPADGRPGRRPQPFGSLPGAPAAPAGERPYSAPPAAGPDASAVRRLGPVWHPRPAAVTCPMEALPANARVPGRPGGSPLRQLATGLRSLDGRALDSAREKGLTYAQARQEADPLTRPYRPEPLPRALAFVRDMRFRDGLPLFRKTARAVGWCGLDAEASR